MAKKVKTINIHSNQLVDGKAKLPTSEQIRYGELAVNYKKGYEVLSFKNDEDEIITINPTDYILKIIENNELVIASALNDINARLVAIEEKLAEEVVPSNPKVGDIAYVDSSSNLKYCSSDDWKSSLGTPVGVVAIPGNFLPDSPEMRLIAIYGVDSAGTRNEKEDSLMIWTSAATNNLPQFVDYDFTGPELDVSSNTIVSRNAIFLCSDAFYVKINPYDTGHGWSSEDVSVVPSPYKADGLFNDQIIDTTFFKEKPNPLTDFNGKEHTDILVGLGSAYTAANAARKYKAYDGDTLEWYLPSIGELAVYFHDFNKINQSISKVGGVQIKLYSNWSSTANPNDAYVLYLASIYGIFGNCYNSETSYCRPFALIS